MKQIFVNPDKCLGCRSCQIACAVEHSAGKNLYSAIAETPKPGYRLYVEQAEGKKIPLTCRHCDPAPCINACISGAISIDSRGIVITNDDRCTGCWTCIMVCPYGVVGRRKETKKSIKCDSCPDLDIPACVNACPTKTLVYAEAEEFSATIRAEAATKYIVTAS